MLLKYIIRFAIIFIFLFLIDLYSFKGIRLITSNLQLLARLIIYYSYWFITLLIFLGIVLISLNFSNYRTPDFYRKAFLLFGFIILVTVPKLVFVIFHLTDDIVYVSKLLITKLFNSAPPTNETTNVISRGKFITQIGIVAAAVPFVSILWGMVKGRFDYRVKNVKLSFNNLPESFNGLRILQISDFHIGSFTGKQNEVKHIVDLINKQACDFIFFTGDMVNNFAAETNEFIDILGKFQAKKGKFSILGNHDYGDYVPWKTQEEKQQNLNTLIDIHKKIGFDILLNENRTITINGQQIFIIGIENWGLPPFPQHGDLKKAMNGIDDNKFKILLSHDPSHWDAQVLNNTNIDLTLSGHTHGMQFGIEIGNFKWSPVKWKYPRWAGLYSVNNQYLYVNRGIGYIGFPGRVGILPEITVIELQSV
ncbi:MAG: metallophosphoesterase [Chlorobi bacterium]|nr:metallophosphoesterase [Chlorobiota bacterium]